jgi:magnesium chelatase subunit D
MKQYLYPFSAIVDQKALKTALLLNAVDPSIGGVLIRGHKGTGKSTAARALAQLLPDIKAVKDSPFNLDPEDPMNLASFEFAGSRQKPGEAVLRPMPFVELPLNATEDRLVGSLHVEKALQKGERIFEPGLLASANRGILYVDEVNLLADHLVDMLLDSTASGVNRIEREGISFVHPARFILIGTMNPEEGELRPQFLDRFGLCVAVESVVDLVSRKEIVQRHLAFENNPEAFFKEWNSFDKTISDQIVHARERLHEVGIPDGLVTAIVSLTRKLQLQGHRADITIIKAARTHAALMEKNTVDKSDLFEAARLAIQHRMKSAPIDPPEALRQKIDDTLNDVLGLDTKNDFCEPEDINVDEMAESMQVPGSCAAGSILFSFLGKKHAETVVEPDRKMAASEIDVEDLVVKGTQGKRRSKATIVSSTGRYLRAERIKPGDQDYHIAVDATLRQTVLRLAREGSRCSESISVKKDDFRKKRLVKALKKLIVFVVDASGSMGSGAGAPMKAAKGAVLAILRKAHQNRSETAMVAFGGQSATLILPPTSSVAAAQSALESLPAGGGTPFADSLSQAWQLIRSERMKNPAVRPILVVISDGEANVPISSGAEPLEEVESLAEIISRDQIATIFIDAAVEQKGEGEMKRIAAKMQASYISIRNLTASSVLEAVLSRDGIEENL